MTTGKFLLRVLICVLISAVFAITADIVLALLQCYIPVPVFIIFVLVLSILLFFIHFSQKTLTKIFIISSALVLLIALIVFLAWFLGYKCCAYNESDSGKNEIYSNKKVLVVVPHQDDDFNLMCGVTEQFVKYGSDVSFVFLFNGEGQDDRELRLNEAITALSVSGIPEKNIIFLGYGNGWQSDHHIYNAPLTEKMVSSSGFTETYGTSCHPAYNDGAVYTRANLENDLSSVIVDTNPDLIFCCDLDINEDHRAASLLFDKVLGRLLNSNPEFRPLVFKGFAYSTAYLAPDDFYSENIFSTFEPDSETYDEIQTTVFKWNQRVRFPIDSSMISRSLLASKLYGIAKIYSSQPTQFLAGRIINGDKVFWLRRTDSVCHNASFETTSGDSSKLNNFMLFDTYNVINTGLPLWEDSWVPNPEDNLKKAKITFDRPYDINEIVLYDNPLLSVNILDAEIVFDNGHSYRSGPLNIDGSATSIPVYEPGVSGFSVQLIKCEGEYPGLTEIEAFSSGLDQYMEKFIKVTDNDGNFVYDYHVASRVSSFKLYTFNCNVKLSDCEITSSSNNCKVSIADDSLIIDCPLFCNSIITIKDNQNNVSDSFVVSNSVIRNPAPAIEKYIYYNYSNLQNCSSYSILRGIYHLFSEKQIVLNYHQ